MLELWDYEFMRKAIVAAVCAGLAAPAIGTYLVQRRLALLGDGLGHVALTGVAVGLLTGWAPLTTAVVLAAAGAIAIELLRTYGKTSGDVALALLFYGGIAGGVLLTAEAGESAATLNTYLFGSITTLSSGELRDIVVLSGLVLVVAVGMSPQLFAICQDEEQSRVSGLPARAYGLVIAVLAAVTVTVSMRTVGLLLASALMVVPVATAQQVSRSFRTTFALAMLLGVAASVGGVAVSFEADTPSGPTIVLLALAGFVLAAPIGAVLTWRRTRLAPFDADFDAAADGAALAADGAPPDHDRSEQHPHEHGPGCGHPAVRHGDHVDYVHDGHRHAPHGQHYDEH